jgi:hypothetical protein
MEKHPLPIRSKLYYDVYFFVKIAYLFLILNNVEEIRFISYKKYIPLHNHAHFLD